MGSPEWFNSAARPISRNDVGRFVVGFSVAGFAAGYIEELRSGLLVVDTGRAGGPLNGNVVADLIGWYTFLDNVPMTLR